MLPNIHEVIKVRAPAFLRRKSSTTNVSKLVNQQCFTYATTSACHMHTTIEYKYKLISLYSTDRFNMEVSLILVVPPPPPVYMGMEAG